MQAPTRRDAFTESPSQGASRRPRWGPWRGKKSAFLGVQKRLWLQWEAKWAKMAFLVVFACHVKYALHDSNAIIAPQQKTSKNNGKMCIFVKEAMRESAMWHFEEVLEGLLEPSVGSNSHQSESRFFQKTVCFIGTFGMWDFAWLTPHPSCLD